MCVSLHGWCALTPCVRRCTQASHTDFLELCVAAALLRERRAILRAEGVDDLLHVVNDLAGRIQVGRLLADARALQARLARTKLADRPTRCVL